MKRSAMNRHITLIGAPTDIGAGSRGASMGPEALRVANIGPVLVSHGLEVIDRGNLSGSQLQIQQTGQHLYLQGATPDVRARRGAARRVVPSRHLL